MASSDANEMQQQCALRSFANLAIINPAAALCCTPNTEPPREQSPEARNHPTGSGSSAAAEPGDEKTKLYLAYGSNLAAETFQGRRGIKPLRSVNVLVPSLQLVFDLPGLPYVEPCFANTRRRHVLPADQSSFGEKDRLLNPHSELHATSDYGWKKGLVGVVYEVTESDYAHIIATEGGGSSYADIEVDCYPLARNAPEVPWHPSKDVFRAHTLFADTSDLERTKNRVDGWAEASPRYLNLLTTGAAENELPLDYRTWLEQLNGYRITTWRQTAGKSLFLATWGPFVFLLFSLQTLLVDKDGKAPKWLALLAMRLFSTMWRSYDSVFKRMFGEGERTIGDPF